MPKGSPLADINAELEVFEQVVKLVRKLVDDRVVWVKFVSPQVIEIVIDRQPFDVEVANSAIPKETVQRVLDDDLSGKLAASLTDTGEMYIAMRKHISPIVNQSNKGDKPDDIALEQQLAVVGKHLATEHLKRRFRAKSQAVRDRFVDCEWQVSRGSTTSLDADAENPLVSITLRFLTEEGPVPNMPSVASFFRPLMASAKLGPTWDLDYDDLEYLIYVLRRAQAACPCPYAADRGDINAEGR